METLLLFFTSFILTWLLVYISLVISEGLKNKNYHTKH